MAAFQADSWARPIQLAGRHAPARPPSACPPVYGGATQPARMPTVPHAPWVGQVLTCQAPYVPDVALVPEMPMPCGGLSTMAFTQRISPPPLRCTLPEPFLGTLLPPALVQTPVQPIADRPRYSQGVESFCESHTRQAGASSGGSGMSVNMGGCQLPEPRICSDAVQYVETGLSRQLGAPANPVLLPQIVNACVPTYAPRAVVGFLPRSQGVVKAQSEGMGNPARAAVQANSRSHSVEVMSGSVKEGPDSFAISSQTRGGRPRAGRVVKVVTTCSGGEKPVKVIGAGMKRRPEGYDVPPPHARVQRQRVGFSEKAVPQGTARPHTTPGGWGKTSPEMSHPPGQELNPHLLRQDLPRQPSSLLPPSTLPILPLHSHVLGCSALPTSKLMHVRAVTPARYHRPITAPAEIGDSSTRVIPHLVLPRPMTALPSKGIHVHVTEPAEGIPVCVAVPALLPQQPGAPFPCAGGPAGTAAPTHAEQVGSAVTDVGAPHGNAVAPSFFPARKLPDVSLAARVLRRHVSRSRWLQEVAGDSPPQPQEAPHAPHVIGVKNERP